MSFLAVLSRDSGLRTAVRSVLEPRHSVATAGSWSRLIHLVSERPVTGVILDQAGLHRSLGAEGALALLTSRFSSLALVMVARPDADPNTLLRLGKAGAQRLVLVRADDLEVDVPRAVALTLVRGAKALVTRSVSPYLPARETRAVQCALDGALRGWGAEEVARRMDLSRPHLSVCLREVGLPSVGHLLTWSRLFHAGLWLRDSGRSAESVSRQLDYSSGAAFRRALKNYTGATPTQVKGSGGLDFVLRRFHMAWEINARGRNAPAA